MHERRTIVVPIDYTPAGSAALAWAVERAEEQDCDVLAVHALERSSTVDARLERDLPGAREQACSRAHAWVIDVLGDRPATDVRVRIVTRAGSVRQVLPVAADRAEIVVLGTSDTAGPLVGSLRSRLACPVVCVDDDGAAHDPASRLLTAE